MEPISTVAAQELAWVRTAARPRAYELRAGQSVAASLRWQKGALAEAVAADGRWTFNRAGFWRPRVTVRAAGSDADLADFRPRWSGAGTLDLSQGRAFRWGTVNRRRSQWAWQTAEGQPLALFTAGRGRTPGDGRVELTPAAAVIPELSLLILLGWYLTVLRAQDESDATTAATTAAIIASTSL